MKFSLRALSLVSCMAAFIAATPLAHADTVNLNVYEGATSYPNTLTGAPATPASATFVLSGAGDLFNFYSPLTNPSSPAYTLGGFLSSGGDTFTGTLMPGVSLGDSINNDIFQFSGNATLSSGVYSFTHDDGMLLYINGVEVISSGAPTSAETSTFDMVAGTYDFELLYAEVNGAPAVLNGYLGTTASTPEPSSFILFGSGLLAAAGVVRRRLAA